ncbi:hypothetical protein GCM10009737_28210 [Nocardioides lentus]|uniref:Uncharacterized protein n=1 Tax=Nocardioides lentus TaxID=338077 RepID=A0ABN2PPH2_9ACTN
MEELRISIQSVAVLVAIGGLFAALRIAKADRRAADLRAEKDREEAERRATEARREESLRSQRADERARWEADRRFRLELLIRLSVNLEHGGSTDAGERKRLGAEASALIAALGPEVLPELHSLRGSEEHIAEVQARMAEKGPDRWTWAENAASVAFALQRVQAERSPDNDPVT